MRGWQPPRVPRTLRTRCVSIAGKVPDGVSHALGRLPDRPGPTSPRCRRAVQRQHRHGPEHRHHHTARIEHPARDLGQGLRCLRHQLASQSHHHPLPRVRSFQCSLRHSSRGTAREAGSVPKRRIYAGTLADNWFRATTPGYKADWAWSGDDITQTGLCGPTAAWQYQANDFRVRVRLGANGVLYEVGDVFSNKGWPCFPPA